MSTVWPDVLGYEPVKPRLQNVVYHVIYHWAINTNMLYSVHIINYTDKKINILVYNISKSISNLLKKAYYELVWKCTCGYLNPRPLYPNAKILTTWHMAPPKHQGCWACASWVSEMLEESLCWFRWVGLIAFCKLRGSPVWRCTCGD